MNYIEKYIDKVVNYERKNYPDERSNIFILSYGEKLLLGVNEEDFLTNGLTIFEYNNKDCLKPVGELYRKILDKEEVFKTTKHPSIELDCWKSVIEYFYKKDEIIIIENEDIEEDLSEFAIGKVLSMDKESFEFTYFDVEGIWNDDIYVISYESITKITARDRYINKFAKYIR